MLRCRSSLPRGAARLVLCAFALLVAPSSLAGEPPNGSDPCSREGRNTCGTLGVGFYAEYRYGVRWFGDFRRAVRGRAHTFCLDLGYWYASPAYRYREDGRAVLRNADGEVVPLERRRRLAYAIWSYGRSASPKQQAAVALYVHSQMGDARPGEADPAVTSLFHRIARDAARYHGPYRVEAAFAGPLLVGREASATVRVRSAAGAALPNVLLRVSAAGARGVPARVRADAAGIASVTFVPTEAGRLRLSVEAPALAANAPLVFRATTKAAAANGQRLAAPSSQRVAATATAPVRARPTVSLLVSKAVVRPGERVSTVVGVRGLGNTEAELQVSVFGPFPSRSAMRCKGRPVRTTTVPIRGDEQVRSPAVELAKAGFYTYRATLAGSALVAPATSPCALETSTALAVPRIATGRALGRRAPGLAPLRVQLAAVGIDAPVAAVGIDPARGSLAVPKDIARAGWWKDGTAPGARSGAVLIAGHVDSARGGEGAFFSLHRARAGDAVRVTTASGRTFVYRVASIRNFRKGSLPLGIFSREGPARLVLVTCGGPFDAAAGRYRDNVVLTALP
jgi:hypothetical protein